MLEKIDSLCSKLGYNLTYFLRYDEIQNLECGSNMSQQMAILSVAKHVFAMNTTAKDFGVK